MKNKAADSFVVLISIDGMAHYYLEDDQVKMPNLRGLMEKGVTARGMESVFPTATWAIHSSMVTGCYPRKQGVLGNWTVSREERRVIEHFGDRAWDKDRTLKKETIYDAAKRNGWTTASICWPVTKGAKSIDYNIPEFYDQDLFEEYCTPDLWNELKAAGLPVECYGRWSREHPLGPLQDWLSAEIAKYLIRHKKPNLLMVHFLLADSWQHDYGVRSKEVYWSLDYIDGLIGELLDTLQEEGLMEKTDIFVVSDHGFTNTNKTFYPNVLFKQEGWNVSDNPDECEVIAVSNGGSGYVYILAEEAGKRERIRKRLRTLLAGTEGVSKVYEPDEFPSLGLPQPGELDHLAPDFAFAMELNYFVHFAQNADAVIKTGAKFHGMHGHHPGNEELKAVFVASGRSIRSGLVIPEIKVVDIAPTMMKLIGEPLADIDGQPLDEIWR